MISISGVTHPHLHLTWSSVGAGDAAIAAALEAANRALSRLRQIDPLLNKGSPSEVVGMTTSETLAAGSDASGGASGASASHSQAPSTFLSPGNSKRKR